MALALVVSQLCGGQPETWKSLLDSHGGLHRIADGRAEYVAREAGLSPSQARRFAALVEVVREAGAEPLEPGAPWKGSADAYAHFRPLAWEPVETFHAVLLDQRQLKLTPDGGPFDRRAPGGGRENERFGPLRGGSEKGCSVSNSSKCGLSADGSLRSDPDGIACSKARKHCTHEPG